MVVRIKCAVVAEVSGEFIYSGRAVVSGLRGCSRTRWNNTPNGALTCSVHARREILIYNFPFNVHRKLLRPRSSKISCMLWIGMSTTFFSCSQKKSERVWNLSFKSVAIWAMVISIIWRCHFKLFLGCFFKNYNVLLYYYKKSFLDRRWLSLLTNTTCRYSYINIILSFSITEFPVDVSLPFLII